ncbi:MAG TPA: glycosyltransferase family 87 protein, partial [Leptospiraceae bacterium]|nr:glycosyltransferase family 87 protein [Leptospiraceae bacterium]
MRDLSRWALIGSFLILALLLFQGLGKSSQTSDFSDYYNASRLFTERKDIYQVDSLKELFSEKKAPLQLFDSEVLNKILSLKGKVASYIYPPVFAFLLIPLSILNYETASAVFNLLNFACLVGVVWMFRRDFDTSRFSVVLFLTLAVSYRFLESHTANNQVAFMLIFLSVAALRIKNDFISGFLLALATIIKLT